MLLKRLKLIIIVLVSITLVISVALLKTYHYYKQNSLSLNYPYKISFCVDADTNKLKRISPWLLSDGTWKQLGNILSLAKGFKANQLNIETNSLDEIIPNPIPSFHTLLEPQGNKENAKLVYFFKVPFIVFIISNYLSNAQTLGIKLVNKLISKIIAKKTEIVDYNMKKLIYIPDYHLYVGLVRNYVVLGNNPLDLVSLNKNALLLKKQDICGASPLKNEQKQKVIHKKTICTLDLDSSIIDDIHFSEQLPLSFNPISNFENYSVSFMELKDTTGRVPDSIYVEITLRLKNKIVAGRLSDEIIDRQKASLKEHKINSLNYINKLLYAKPIFIFSTTLSFKEIWETIKSNFPRDKTSWEMQERKLEKFFCPNPNVENSSSCLDRKTLSIFEHSQVNIVSFAIDEEEITKSKVYQGKNDAPLKHLIPPTIISTELPEIMKDKIELILLNFFRELNSNAEKLYKGNLKKMYSLDRLNYTKDNRIYRIFIPAEVQALLGKLFSPGWAIKDNLIIFTTYLPAIMKSKNTSHYINLLTTYSEQFLPASSFIFLDINAIRTILEKEEIISKSLSQTLQAIFKKTNYLLIFSNSDGELIHISIIPLDYKRLVF